MFMWFQGRPSSIPLIGKPNNPYFETIFFEYLVVSEPPNQSVADHFVNFLLPVTCGKTCYTPGSHVNNACGLAGQCSIVESSLRPNLPCCVTLGMTQRAPWQMTKTELLAEANRLGLAPLPGWTAGELRSAITEVTAEANKGNLPNGLSSMRLQDLKEEAMKIGLPVGEKATRGSLMRSIRNFHATPNDTVMTVGKHKGNTYEQIPIPYANWADAEEKHRRRTHPGYPEQATILEKMNNPEKYAVADYPGELEAMSSHKSWEEVGSIPGSTQRGRGSERQLPVTPQPSASSSSATRPSKRPAAKDKGTSRMGVEVDPKFKRWKHARRSQAADGSSRRRRRVVKIVIPGSTSSTRTTRFMRTARSTARPPAPRPRRSPNRSTRSPPTRPMATVLTPTTRARLCTRTTTPRSRRSLNRSTTSPPTRPTATVLTLTTLARLWTRTTPPRPRRSPNRSARSPLTRPLVIRPITHTVTRSRVPWM